VRKIAALTLVPALLLTAFSSAPASAAPMGQTTVAALFSELRVASDSIATYSRSAFEHWIDADGDGCDTRQEVLAKESLTPVVLGSGCTIISGQWTSWYDDASWTNPADVDIDHMVPLSEAWKSGAYGWTGEQRRDYANDLDLDVALEAVTDNVNQSKSDRDPAYWLPPAQSEHCRYVADWVQVKYRWSLTVDMAERNALSAILTGTCGSTMVTVPDLANAPAASLKGVQRIAGADRYATAVAISSRYPTGVGVVYVATGGNYPDALSAAPAAAAQGGPLLLTATASLPGTVGDEIRRLRPALIVVAGGPNAVSETVYRLLANLAPTIRRDAGADRYETSRVINMRAFSAGASRAFFATGGNFPDALSASAAAGSTASPVILLNGGAAGVDSATRTLITNLGVTSGTIVGGTAVVSTAVETSLRGMVSSVIRAAGADRYSTSRAINREAFASAPVAYFAVGTGFADALAGAALAGREHAPLYVVPSTCVPQATIADVQAFATTGRVLLGGQSALGSGVENLIPCLPPPLPPAPPAAPAPPAPPASPANPGNAVNCDDFGTWQEAQNWYLRYLAAYGDVAGLDRDHDGIACETLPGHP
jgi:putative cell wall-binding protein